MIYTAATCLEQKQWVAEGIMYPQCIVDIQEDYLFSKTGLAIDFEVDDLDGYKVAYLTINDIPFMIQRYRTDALNHFTLYCDSEQAIDKGLSVTTLTDTLLQILDVSTNNVLWRTDYVLTHLA